MDFFVSKQDQKPEKGDLLISEPFLPDPNFKRTVIFICAHDENGTFGLVLNKKTHLKLKDIVDEVESIDTEIFVGGPVQQDTLHFLHRDKNVSFCSQEVASGIYWGGDYEEIIHRFSDGLTTSEDIKFFVGYSGWSEGQLEREIEENSWIIFKGTLPEMIFEWDNQELWKACLQTIGGKYRLMSNYPKDPKMN